MLVSEEELDCRLIGLIIKNLFGCFSSHLSGRVTVSPTVLRQCKSHLFSFEGTYSGS